MLQNTSLLRQKFRRLEQLSETLKASPSKRRKPEEKTPKRKKRLKIINFTIFHLDSKKPETFEEKDLENEILSLLEQNKKLEEEVKIARLKEKDTERRLSADFELKWQHLFGEKENNNYPENLNLASSKVFNEKINWKNKLSDTKEKKSKDLLLSKYTEKEQGIRERIERTLFEKNNEGKKEIFTLEKNKKKENSLFGSTEKNERDGREFFEGNNPIREEHLIIEKKGNGCFLSNDEEVDTCLDKRKIDDLTEEIENLMMTLSQRRSVLSEIEEVTEEYSSNSIKKSNKKI